VKPRSIRALAIAYYDSAAFKALKPITKGVYRNIIERFCRAVDRGGEPYGDKSAITLKIKDVQKLMERRVSPWRWVSIPGRRCRTSSRWASSTILYENWIREHKRYRDSVCLCV
jgi:hypothetical protein